MEESKSGPLEVESEVELVCCINAAGQYAPPMFIFKRKIIQERLIRNGAAG